MSMFKVLLLCTFALASPAMAEPLADMSGSWSGSGWARERPQGPQETIRCKIDNTFDEATSTLNISGRCAVPGRQLTMSGILSGSDGSDRITGRWSNPDGIGSARVIGFQRDGIVAFTFAANDLTTGQDLAQNVEWRTLENTLRLRSTDRSDPNIMMSDITFSK
ncbi:MAG: hypothetical protein WBN04_03740 [Paracoccaceae bacterium]